MADPIGIVGLALAISDGIQGFILLSTGHLQVQSELCDLQKNLQKLRPILAALPTTSTQDSSEKCLYLSSLLRNSENTARGLYDLLPLDCDGDREQDDVESLLLSVKMMSAGLNQLRLELYKDCHRQGDIASSVSLNDTANLNSCTCDISSTASDLPCLYLEDDNWVSLNLRPCPADHQYEPAEALIQKHAKTGSVMSHIAKTVSKVTSYLSRNNRKRGIDDEVKIANFDTPKEYIDCAAWFLEQARSSSIYELEERKLRRRIRPCSPHRRRLSLQEESPVDSKSSSVQHVFPEHPGQRYFSIRAACCVHASLRPLTPRELFVASTTKLLPNDHEWPFQTNHEQASIAELMHICDNFLRLDDKGSVHFREEYSDLFLGENGPILGKDAHLFMSLVCLHQMKRQPRLILKPWLDYHRLETEEENFPLHSYVVRFWHSHCRAAEGSSTKIPNELHLVIQAAWLSERRAECPFPSDSAIKELDMLLVQGEALDIGLEVSISHGFSELAKSYRKMGAKPAEENSFDFREWVSIEPLDGRDASDSTEEHP